jgi:hypothetical protein
MSLLDSPGSFEVPPELLAVSPSVGERRLYWRSGEAFKVLPILPNDILTRYRIPNGIKVQCIDGRFQPEEGQVYLRIPGGGLGLVADVYTALTEVWGEEYLKAHEAQLIGEMMDFFGGKIVGHSDEKGCETGFCGCGHLKQTVFTECTRADENLRSFLRKISSNNQVFERHVLSGDHFEKEVIHAGKFDVPSSISGVQAFVYHGEYHQAMIEAMSRRLAYFIARIESREDLNRETTLEHAERIMDVMNEVSSARLESTVERLANGFEHIKLEGPNENEFENVGKRVLVLRGDSVSMIRQQEEAAEAA